MAQHCISCGKKGARWPKRNPSVCTAKCAAGSFIDYAEMADSWEASHCPKCGGPSGSCHCPVRWGWEADEVIESESFDFGVVRAWDDRNNLLFSREADTREELLKAIEAARATAGATEVYVTEPN